MGRIDLPPICKCTLSQQMMGNGCGICSPEATIAGLVQEVKALEDERDNLRDHIHTCGPTCMKAGCVNRRLREAIESDAMTVNFMRHAGLDKHKARECKEVVGMMLRAALGEKA